MGCVAGLEWIIEDFHSVPKKQSCAYNMYINLYIRDRKMVLNRGIRLKFAGNKSDGYEGLGWYSVEIPGISMKCFISFISIN